MFIKLIAYVFTTGSTVDECSRVLRLAGAVRIEVFTLARSLPR
jgi:predicted amidophosphoribosyltransferase